MAHISIRLVRAQHCSCLCVKHASSSVPTSTQISANRKECRQYSTGPTLVTSLEESKRFMRDCLLAIGSSPENAETVSLNLLEADYRGHYSHGMNRLEMYIRDIQHGTANPKILPKVINETSATGFVDGRNGLGAVIGKFCMELAIKKAKDVGIGFVVTKGSNHYGIAGIYSLQAINEGLIGMSVTNTSPLMTPTRAKQVGLAYRAQNSLVVSIARQVRPVALINMSSFASIGYLASIEGKSDLGFSNGIKEATLGTNPIALGAPGIDDDSFLLDMATTAVAVGKIEIAQRKGEPIPEGWALNDEGIPESNPGIAYKASKLMPLGGPEIHSGYKGFGLGMFVEIFSGLLAGSAYGPNIRRWGTFGKYADLGQGFMAIDPKVFAPGFDGRLQDLMDYLRKMEPVDSNKPVLVHGDKEKMHMQKVHDEGGLRYVENQHKTNRLLSDELKVAPMVSKIVHIKAEEHME